MIERLTGEVAELGTINQWPDGYAMTLGFKRIPFAHGVVRCCSGHETPTEAKAHGIARLVEVAIEAANRDVAAWNATAVGEAS